MLAAQYRLSVPWSCYSWALYNISHALCFSCGQNMAAASDDMFESARPDRPLKLLEVESAHSSQGRSKKWSKLSVVSSAQPNPAPSPPPKPPPPPPNGWGEGRRDSWHFNATWVVVLVLPVLQAKYARNYLCTREIADIRVCEFWIRLKHRMIGEHCRVRRSFYRLTKNKKPLTSSSHNTFNKETGFSWKIRSDENDLKDLFPAVKYVDLPHRFSSDLQFQKLVELVSK